MPVLSYLNNLGMGGGGATVVLLQRGGDDAPKKRRRKSSQEELNELLERVTAPQVPSSEAVNALVATPSQPAVAAFDEDDEEVLLALA